jgi:hypothetical protein
VISKLDIKDILEDVHKLSPKIAASLR